MEGNGRAPTRREAKIILTTQKDASVLAQPWGGGGNLCSPGKELSGISPTQPS